MGIIALDPNDRERPDGVELDDSVAKTHRHEFFHLLPFHPRIELLLFGSVEPDHNCQYEPAEIE